MERAAWIQRAFDEHNVRMVRDLTTIMSLYSAPLEIDDDSIILVEHDNRVQYKDWRFDAKHPDDTWNIDKSTHSIMSITSSHCKRICIYPISVANLLAGWCITVSDEFEAMAGISTRPLLELESPVKTRVLGSNRSHMHAGERRPPNNHLHVEYTNSYGRLEKKTAFASNSVPQNGEFEFKFKYGSDRSILYWSDNQWNLWLQLTDDDTEYYPCVMLRKSGSTTARIKILD